MDTRVASIRQSIARWLSLLVAPLAISLITMVVTNLSTAQTLPPWLWGFTIVAFAVAVLMYFIGQTPVFERALTTVAKK